MFFFLIMYFKLNKTTFIFVNFLRSFFLISHRKRSHNTDLLSHYSTAKRFLVISVAFSCVLCCVSYKAYEKRYCDDLLKYLNNHLSYTSILSLFIQIKMDECLQFKKKQKQNSRRMLLSLFSFLYLVHTYI